MIFNACHIVSVLFIGMIKESNSFEDRDYQLEEKLKHFEYDINVLDYGSNDYALADEEAELEVDHKIAVIRNEFGLNMKKEEEKSSCCNSFNLEIIQK